MGRTALVTASVVLLVLLVSLLGVWGLQRQLIYLPGPSAGRLPTEALPGVREVVLDTADGVRLRAWFAPARPPDRGVAVLLAPGNAGTRAARVPLAQGLTRNGMSVLLLDYRGYAGNAGDPSETGLARDARAAHRYLTVDAGFDRDRLLYLGESLGAAVVTELAVERPPAGLVLRSPFTDLAAVGQEHYPFLPVSALLWDRYPLVRQLANVRIPTTVVLGTEDSVVPAAQSRTVAAAAPVLHRLVEVEGADHNDPALTHGPELVGAVSDLAARVVGP